MSPKILKTILECKEELEDCMNQISANLNLIYKLDANTQMSENEKISQLHLIRQDNEKITNRIEKISDTIDNIKIDIKIIQDVTIN